MSDLNQADAVLIENCSAELATWLEQKMKSITTIKKLVVRLEVIGSQRFKEWCTTNNLKGLYVVVKNRPSISVVKSDQKVEVTEDLAQAKLKVTEIYKDLTSTNVVDDYAVLPGTGSGIFVHSNQPLNFLVNAVNTQGVMGKGIAEQFKRFYPESYFHSYWENCAFGIRYQEETWKGTMVSGWTDPNKTLSSVINLPTKCFLNESMNKVEFVKALYILILGWLSFSEKERGRLIFPKGVGKGLARPKEVPQEKWDKMIDTTIWMVLVNCYHFLDSKSWNCGNRFLGKGSVINGLNKIYYCDQKGNLEKVIEIFNSENWDNNYTNQWKLLNEIGKLEEYNKKDLINWNGRLIQESFEWHTDDESLNKALRKLNEKCFRYEFEGDSKYKNTILWSSKK